MENTISADRDTEGGRRPNLPSQSNLIYFWLFFLVFLMYNVHFGIMKMIATTVYNKNNNWFIRVISQKLYS